MTRKSAADTEHNMSVSRRAYLQGLGVLGILFGTGTTTGAATVGFADSDVVSVGSGSYARRRPQPDASTFTDPNQQYKYVDPSPISEDMFLTDDAPPTPQSNSWWANNWFTRTSDPHGNGNPTIPLPWYTETTTGGLTAIYADAWLANPGETQADRNRLKLDFRYTPRILLGHSATSFSESRVDDWGDFHTRLSWGTGTRTRMDVTLVKGSPFLFAEYTGGDAEITLADLNNNAAADDNIEVWADRGNVLGVTIDGIDTDKNYERHFGIFAPDDATWNGVGTSTLTSSLGSGDYLTIAPLPTRSTSTLDRLESYAYNIVRDTRVTYDYVPTDSNGSVVSEVRSTFEFVTDDKAESEANGSLAGLMPHQWKYTAADLSDIEYWSPRGTLKVHAGTSFRTTKTYPGVLPHMPDEGDYNRSTLQSYVDLEETAPLWNRGVGSESDTYWVSKDFDHHLRTIPIAQQVGDTAARDRSVDALRNRLESWLTVQNTNYGTTKEEEAFAYWEEFGSLIGYPSGFFSSEYLNDHHFHYGYFVKTAAELARHDGQFIEEYGDMIDLLVREYSNWERPTSDSVSETTPRDTPKDAFPYLRNFDAYEGHSWASGFCLDDGANQESSSEAMMASSSIIMWAEHRMATADSEAERTTYREMRDTAIAVYTEEMHAIWEYWFDKDNDSHPDDWGSNRSEDDLGYANGAPGDLNHDAYEYASRVFGNGYDRETWWNNESMEEIWGINWLPIDGHSLYLNWDENYADANWKRMVAARGGDTNFLDTWHTATIGYRALSDPADAVDIAEQELPIKRKSAHIYHWTHNLKAMGTPSHDVVADSPQAAVFEDDSGTRTYVAYNADGSTKTVNFSDGVSMDVPANSLKTSNGNVTEGLRASRSTDLDSTTSAPTNLTTPAHDASSVDLSWDGSTADDLAHYVVYRDGTKATEVPARPTSVTVDGLAADTTYDFAVSAVDDAGTESSAVGPVTVTTDSDSATSGTETINGDGWTATLSESSGSELRLEFDHDANANWADIHYTINDGIKLNHRMNPQDSSHTHTVDGLSAGDTVDYDFTYEEEGLAWDTETVTYTFGGSSDTTAPAAPTALSSPDQDTTSVTLSWDASTASDVDHYTVYLNGSQTQTVTDGTTAAIVGDLSTGTGYDLSVSATDGSGNESVKPGPITVTTDSDTTAPTVPSALRSPANDASSVTLSWDAATDTGSGVSHYNVYVDGATAPTVQTPETTATVSGLSADTSYEFTVSAVDQQDNESSKPSPVAVTTTSIKNGDETASGDSWTATLTNPDSGKLKFEFDHDANANWADIHYTINDGIKLNHRMNPQDSSHTHTVDGLSAGDTVDYDFTYEEEGLAWDTETYTYDY